MRITIKQELYLITEILTRMGVSEEDAAIVAEVTADADLKGFSSHGIGRFPQYIKGLKMGTINPQAEVTVERESPATALLKGNHGFGHVIAYKGMKMAIEKAKNMGIGMVGINNSNHFGIAGYYSDMAIMQDLIGMVITNTEPAVAPIGGKEPLLGTNPIAIGIPSNVHYVSVDMATSAAARGKIMEAMRRGEEIPENVALDAEGNPTIDPCAAIKGSILPFGAHKGYALAFMIEIMSGPLVGAAYGKYVTGTANPEVECTKGDLLSVIDPSCFVDLDQFKSEVDDFIAEVKATPNVFIPGDMEIRNIRKFKKDGVSIDKKLEIQLKDLCQEVELRWDDVVEK